MAKKLFFFTIAFCLSLLVMGQHNDPCRKSTEGTDFWFGFIEGRWDRGNNHYVEITVSAREATTFTITIGNSSTLYGTFSVESNNSTTERIPWDLVEAIGSEIIENKAIHLVAEKPVNVYALNFDRSSADVALIYPIQSLGKEYYAMTYSPNENDLGRNSEFMVVATEDSTMVEITPTVNTDNGQPGNSTDTIILNKGQLYQVQAHDQDLTGSFVKSDKPVAFFAGSHGTTIPNGYCCWDHLYEQIPPIHSWGREYYAVPLKSREQDRYRIMAAKDETAIFINGTKIATLNKGEFFEKVLYHNQPSLISADKPILVAQFSQSRDVDDAYTGGNGDPFMIILSSVSQTKNDVTFVAYRGDQITSYFLNIICLTSELSNLRLNDNVLSSNFTPFPNSEYSYAQINIGAGSTNRLYNKNPDRGFLAYVYGYGGVESYGYGVGFNLDLVLDLGESIDFQGDTMKLCAGESLTLDAGPYFDTYFWRNTKDTTQTLEVRTVGDYHVTTTTIDGCVLEDSIYVFVSDPQIDLKIADVEECSPFSLPLNPANDFQEYVWLNINSDTLSKQQNITIDSTNTYILNAFNELGCPARDTVNLVVFPVPKVNIKGEKLICAESVSSAKSSLEVDISEAPVSAWNYEGSFTWDANSPNVSFTNPKHQSTDVLISEWGTYQVYYELETTDGCLSSDTFEVSFFPTPTSDFMFVEDPDDECKGYTREVLYTGNATENANYYWDFGGSKVIDSMNWNRFTVSLGAFNSNPYISLNIEERGCWSKEVSPTLIGANPDFALLTEKARGCDSMSVLFNGELNVEDDLRFEWEFGDGSGIFNDQEIIHFYSDTGFYDVSLTITNQLSGCQIGFQIDSMIKIFPTPKAEITADPDHCYPDSAQLIYTHNIDSSFCTWSFEGAHQSGNGNDSIIMIMDEPFGKAILTVDEFGCTSEPSEITLKRKPHFDFRVDNTEGCQPYLTELFAEPNDESLQFTWITDSLPYPVGESALYLFPDSGRADVTVVANSMETGCLDTLTKEDWIWVHPKPVAEFEVDYPVALLEHATITFTNLSSMHDISFWEFGDGSTSGEEHPQNTYTALGEYNSQLFVESVYGCADTSEFLIKILPFSVFTPTAFRPDSEIPENRTFMPVGVGADPSRFNLKIFDRWGQIVFESNTPDHPWDGKTPKGEQAPMGNYVWISNYFDIQGFEHKQKGQVFLVR